MPAPAAFTYPVTTIMVMTIMKAIIVMMAFTHDRPVIQVLALVAFFAVVRPRGSIAGRGTPVRR
jgi:L-asparagine transporter-like permease